MAATVVSAAAIVADPERVFAPGVLAFAGETITWVGPTERLPSDVRGAERWRFPDLVIIPGFVNAHTHLDLSGLRGVIPPGNFCTWVARLLRWLWTHPDYDRRAAAGAGIAECVQAGTAAVGDVASVGGLADSAPAWESASALDVGPLGGVVFLEVLGLGPAAIKAARRRLSDSLPGFSNPRLRIGVSPHAPYGTEPEIYRICARFARRNGLRLMTHVAETREECEFLRHGRGLMRAVALLGRLSGTRFDPPGCSPVQYVARLGVLAPDVVLVHLNYASDDDIRLVAGAGAHVVFCPGSHRFFGHDPHPVERLLDAGVNVALGTDSLASNESLSMLREIRLLRESHPAIPAAQALDMATRNAAVALGIEDAYGTLGPGMSAAFLGLRPPDGLAASDPIEAALSPDSRLELVVIAGERIR
ncbi:MAG: amidohydrolase family protein [Armatimonadota bacterium]